MNEKPVMYLDIDDVLLDWSGGGMIPRAAEGAREFLLWALEHYEVRWLTYWAPNGRLNYDDAVALARALRVQPEILLEIKGLDWSGDERPIWGVQTKLDGIAWVEHLVMGRPFVWVEDETVIVPQGLDRTLQALGLLHCWLHVNTTRRGDSLRALHERLVGSSSGLTGCVTEAQLAELVDRALANEDSLDALYNKLVFGGKPPRMWGNWPAWARDGWDAAVRLYFARKGRDEQRGRRSRDLLDAGRAWDAVEECVASSDDGGFTWAELGRTLGMGERRVIHMFVTRLGFRTASFQVAMPKGRIRKRRVTAGPCVRCLTPIEVERLEGRLCPTCRLEDQSPAEVDLCAQGARLGAGEEAEARR